MIQQASCIPSQRDNTASVSESPVRYRLKVRGIPSTKQKVEQLTYTNGEEFLYRSKTVLSIIIPRIPGDQGIEEASQRS